MNNHFLLSSFPKNMTSICNNNYKYGIRNNYYLCSIFIGAAFVLSVLFTFSHVSLRSL